MIAHLLKANVCQDGFVWVASRHVKFYSIYAGKNPVHSNLMDIPVNQLVSVTVHPLVPSGVMTPEAENSTIYFYDFPICFHG